MTKWEGTLTREAGLGSFTLLGRSDFGLRISFGFRPSGFGFPPPRSPPGTTVVRHTPDRISSTGLSRLSAFLPLEPSANPADAVAMKLRTGPRVIRPILYKSFCWPVKIRVRAEPPLLAPRIPPDFPASHFSESTPWMARLMASLAQARTRVDHDTGLGRRALGKQDGREEA
jgi:hypothetical protein